PGIFWSKIDPAAVVSVIHFHIVELQRIHIDSQNSVMPLLESFHFVKIRKQLFHLFRRQLIVTDLPAAVSHIISHDGVNRDIAFIPDTAALGFGRILASLFFILHTGCGQLIARLQIFCHLACLQRVFHVVHAVLIRPVQVSPHFQSVQVDADPLQTIHRRQKSIVSEPVETKSQRQRQGDAKGNHQRQPVGKYLSEFIGVDHFDNAVEYQSAKEDAKHHPGSFSSFGKAGENQPAGSRQSCQQQYFDHRFASFKGHGMARRFGAALLVQPEGYCQKQKDFRQQHQQILPVFSKNRGALQPFSFKRLDMGQIEKSRRKHLRNFPSQLLISRIESLEKFLEIPQRHLPYQKSISVEHTQSQKADQDTSGQKDGNQRQMIQQQKIQHMHRRSDNQAHQHRRRTYCFYDTNDQKQHQTESIWDDKSQNAAHILDEKQPFPGHRNAVKQIQLSGRLQKRKPSEGRQDRS